LKSVFLVIMELAKIIRALKAKATALVAIALTPDIAIDMGDRYGRQFRAIDTGDRYER
jgi:hypothetical protein